MTCTLHTHTLEGPDNMPGQVRDGTVCEGWTVVRWEIRKANNMEMMLNQLAPENAPYTHTLEGPDDMPGERPEIN